MLFFSPFAMWALGTDLRSQAWQQAPFRAEFPPFSHVHILVMGFSSLQYAALLRFSLHENMDIYVLGVMYKIPCRVIYIGLKFL